MKESRPEKPHPYDIAHKMLRQNEQVLWEGAPAHKLFFHRDDIIFRFSIGLFCWAVLILQLISGGDASVCVVLLIVALLLTVLPLAVMARKLRKSYYILAESRVILVTDNEVTTWSYDSLKHLEVTDRQLGVYTVYIEYAEEHFPRFFLAKARIFGLIYLWFDRFNTWDSKAYPRGALVNLREADKDRVCYIIRSHMFKKETI